MLRSYSRNTGSTSHEIETSASGMLLGEDRRRRAARAPGWRSCAAARWRPSRCLRPRSRARPRAPPPRRAAPARCRRGRCARRPRRCARAGPGRCGFTQANRLARRGMSWRPISSTYLKPAVVSSAAVRALALQDQVGRDRRAVQHAADVGALRAPRSFSTSAMPLPKPRDGSSGVDGVLATTARPVAGSSSVTSVNVPPVSTPTMTRGLVTRRPSGEPAGSRGDGKLGLRPAGAALVGAARSTRGRRRPAPRRNRASALARLTKPPRTSASTRSGSRSNGWPQPPPPPVSTRMTSPRRQNVAVAQRPQHALIRPCPD